MPGVEGCLLVRAASAKEVLLALRRIAEAAEFIAEEVGPAFCACSIALGGRTEGGRVVWARGDG